MLIKFIIILFAFLSWLWNLYAAAKKRSSSPPTPPDSPAQTPRPVQTAQIQPLAGPRGAQSPVPAKPRVPAMAAKPRESADYADFQRKEQEGEQSMPSPLDASLVTSTDPTNNVVGIEALQKKLEGSNPAVLPLILSVALSDSLGRRWKRK